MQKSKDNLSTSSEVASSGAAETSLRESIRSSWRGRKVSSHDRDIDLSPAIRLTDRDYEILRFITEMKFATHFEVHHKFFRKLPNGSHSVSLEAARKRIYELQTAGYVRAVYIGEPEVRHAIITRAGYNRLKEKFPDEQLAKPALFLDVRLVPHDRFVLHERLRLEEMHGNIRWQSDRFLQSQPANDTTLEKSHWPDGIYQTPDGTRVAFELENADKGKSAYRRKIEKYVWYFRETAEDRLLFDHVRFVCVTKYPYRYLSQDAEIYPSYFTVEWLTPFEMLGGAK